MNIVYTSLPEFAPKEDYWVLSWSNLYIPIPAKIYQEVKLNRENSSDISVHLLANDGTLVLFNRFYSNKLMQDMLKKDWISKVKNNPGQALPSFRLSDLVDIGYRTRLSDIDCNTVPSSNDELTDQVIKLIALVLKAGTPDFNAIHALNLNTLGFARVGFDDQRRAKTYDIDIVDDARKNDEMIQIAYRIPQSEAGFSLFSGITKKPITVGNPAWIIALNTALNSNQENNWTRFFDEAKKAGISEQNIQTSMKRLEL